MGSVKNNQYEEFIIKWAEDRNILEDSDTSRQALKSLEELGELAADISRSKNPADSIGDLLVTLIIGRELARRNKYAKPKKEDQVLSDLVSEIYWVIRLHLLVEEASEAVEEGLAEDVYHYALLYTEELAEALGIDKNTALAKAWDEIKDRKGKMVNGTFVKEDDL